jgi:Domain of unknown function (DUF4338)
MALKMNVGWSAQNQVDIKPASWTAAQRAELASAIVCAHQACQSAVQGGEKDYLRALHCAAQGGGEVLSSAMMLTRFSKLEHWFRTGPEIDPSRIDPYLHPVETREDEDLWRVARACWSMPYSKGYGRRLRFLVIDRAHDALIGILGLQSPPADLKSRDDLFAYPPGQKLNFVNQTLDAYTVGAIPPYSFLLGGKLVAGLISSDEVRQAYWRRYAAKRTRLVGQLVSQPLVAVTTTSAFGRSSMYNRLRYQSRLLAEPIGYTLGYGMLHLEHLYQQITKFLAAEGALTQNGYGNGPKVRWQNATKALVALGLPRTLLVHGVQRQVFLFSLVERLEDGMAGGMFGLPIRLTASEYGQFWRERWAQPRAERFPHWNQTDSRRLIREKLLNWTLPS